MHGRLISGTLPFLLAAVTAAGRSPVAASPSLHFAPRHALMDETVRIRLAGLPPRQPVTVRASARLLGCAARSEATYLTDRHGCVDLARQAPVRGSYSGIDPMGLF